MAKLKITQEQYNKIILREQASRSSLLTETTHEVVLGVAKLAGLKLSGHNETVAKNALNDAKTMGLIKSTLEDENKVKELVKKMEEKGMKDVESFLSKNVESIVKNYNQHAKTEKLDFITKTNLLDLSGK
jgi:hypothetical protein